ncbi:MAG: hypothetical protein LBQ52_05250 [Helicobacteraceae bacterium]|jgi:hypothetical protein|nr:hypothetical protein [Helicobacteraceae bacterium]
MDLKEMVLSALADIQEEQEVAIVEQTPIEQIGPIAPREELAAPKEPIAEPKPIAQNEAKETTKESRDDEERFLAALKERLLTLFEGFQSPNNRAVEAKIDLTLNFLEYLLSAIEERLDELEKK